ncbi:hypothetical protein KC343_g2614 [Hortaea werneckii]|uniref:Enoyl reductase (ER) domain-containing protein n=1 Tax=Hortaea werneckii TaxID=91943 RepID=A0A3M7GR03_HORWE|nr:hypothetical protein KC352_g21467 [Hortaea werneckii]KAI7569842.1 hypothetical protein KC317_g2976 [Hortaea werneckii]KAI7623624.1 hypothetical protein KC346_g2643 [Hortaea werneckii]KAI7633989.1 hypothetical protein KC343_g2614 [Hortaea werneckii]KAI7679858.1 hypothetical protein KC319_g2524 [Hortaea werneckii]
MKALRFHGKGDIRLDEIDTPICLPDEVRIQVAYCGICGTDVHEYLEGPILLPQPGSPNPHTGATIPLTMGHEMSGTISEIGEDVQYLHVGERVVVNPAMDDRHHGQPPCSLCLSGRPNICSRSAFYGLQCNSGGFAEEICVKAIAVVPIPQDMSLKVATLSEPLAVASHMIRTSGFQPGQSVVIFGAGPIGCALAWFLKKGGASYVLVSEITPQRAIQAFNCGADIVIDPSNSPDAVLDAVVDRTSDGADIAFDACGLQSTLDAAFNCTKPGGVIFNVAIHDRPLTLQLNALTLSEKKLLAGNAYTAEDYRNVLTCLKEHEKDLERFITRIVPLDRAVEDGFRELVHNKFRQNKILVEISGDSNWSEEPLQRSTKL